MTTALTRLVEMGFARDAAAAALARRRASASIEAKQLGKLVEANFTEYPDCDIYGLSLIHI